jgi:hypothetical protein
MGALLWEKSRDSPDVFYHQDSPNVLLRRSFLLAEGPPGICGRRTEGPTTRRVVLGVMLVACSIVVVVLPPPGRTCG